MQRRSKDDAEKGETRTQSRSTVHTPKFTPANSSSQFVQFSFQGTVQSSPVPFRSDHLSPITPADLVLLVEPRTEPPRTVLGGVQQQTGVAPGFARLGRHNIIVTHSTSYSQITSHSHTSHSALQQTPHNTK